MTARPATYLQSLALVRPLIDRWKKSNVVGGSTESLPCPACAAGTFTIHKAALTGHLRGSCTTPFCINFSEA